MAETRDGIGVIVRVTAISSTTTGISTNDEATEGNGMTIGAAMVEVMVGAKIGEASAGRQRIFPICSHSEKHACARRRPRRL